jgi:hypothetical protein
MRVRFIRICESSRSPTVNKSGDFYAPRFIIRRHEIAFYDSAPASCITVSPNYWIFIGKRGGREQVPMYFVVHFVVWWICCKYRGFSSVGKNGRSLLTVQ